MVGENQIWKIQKILDSVIAIPPQKNFESHPLHIHYFKTGSQFFISEYSLQKFIWCPPAEDSIFIHFLHKNKAGIFRPCFFIVLNSI